jgi:hypothetical protein
MVTHINAVNLITLGIADITIKGTPTEAEGTYKNVIKEIDVSCHNNSSAYPPSPSGQVLQKTNKNIRTPM